MGIISFIGFVILGMLPTLVSTIGGGDPRMVRPLEMLLEMASTVRWLMLSLSAISFSGFLISFVWDGKKLPGTKSKNIDGENEKPSSPSERAVLESKVEVVTKQIEKVNSYIGRKDLPDDQRSSLLSAIAFLSKQKAFIEFRFIALDQIEWELKIRQLYAELEKLTGTDERTIDICGKLLTEIATGCEDRLKKLNVLDTDSVTDSPEVLRAVRELRSRIEEIERITNENRRHLQTREIAGTLSEIRQLEDGESNIENDFQGAIPVQFITSNIEPLDTELIFQKMRIESLKDLDFSDSFIESQKQLD